VRVTLVVDRPEVVYSGMVPGFVAGDYAAHEVAIDVVPLARRARARVVIARAVSVDPAAHRIELEGRPPIAYDVASPRRRRDVRGLDLPGVREHALATRPIARLVDELPARVAALPERPRIAVVGGGAAGVELALTLDARPARDRPRPRGGDRRRGRDAARGLRECASSGSPRAELAARGHRATPGRDGLRGARGRDRLRGRDAARRSRGLGDRRRAAAVSLRPRLPLDASGFVAVAPTLDVVGTRDLFAVGDCASLSFAPWVRKAGVYRGARGSDAGREPARAPVGRAAARLSPAARLPRPDELWRA
jgi:selenide,water dikinase